MLGIELALRAKSWLGRVAYWWVAGLAISQMIAGWIGQGAYNGMLLVGAYLAYRTLIQPSISSDFKTRIRETAIHGAGVFALGIALSAAGLFIRLQVNQTSNLAGGAYDEVTERGTEAWEWLGMLDRILSNDRSTLKFYIGGAVFALAILAPFVARKRFSVPFFAFYTVAILVMTLKTTPLHHLLYLLPRYQSLHEHAAYRIIGLLWVGPAMLAAATVAALPEWAKRKWAIPVALIPIAAILFIVNRLDARGDSIHDQTIAMAIAAPALLLLAIAVGRIESVRLELAKAWIPKLVPIAILGLVLTDPSGVRIFDTLGGNGGSASIQRSTDLLAGTTDPGGAGEFLQQQAKAEQPFRFFGYDSLGLRTADTDGLTYHGQRLVPLIQDLLVSARPMRLHLQDIQGYNPIQLDRYVEFIEAINGVKLDYHDADIYQAGVRSSLLDLLNVRYVVIPNEIPPGRPRPDLSYLISTSTEVFRNDSIRVLERQTELPRAWIVHDAITVEKGEALDLLTNGGVDPAETAVIERDPPSLAVPADSSSEVATVTDYEDDEIRLSATAGADGLLVVSEIYDEGWNAYVDGKKVDIYATDHVLRGIPIAAGEHEVVLKYEPIGLRAGVPVSLAAVAVLPILGLIAFWRRRPWRRV
jgi:hypothetical protein